MLKVVAKCPECKTVTVQHEVDKLRRCTQCKNTFDRKDNPVNRGNTFVTENGLAIGLVFSSPLSSMDVIVIGFAGDDVLYRAVGHDYEFLKHNRVSKKQFVMWCNGDTEHVRR